MSGTGAVVEVSSNNGLLLGRSGGWASQMDIDLQQLALEAGVGTGDQYPDSCRLSMADFVLLVNLCL